MYIEDNFNIWNNLHQQNQFQLDFPSELVIRFIKRHFPESSNKILDLGCGTGRHVIYLAREGYNVSGIDFSESGIQLTSEKLQVEGLNANLKNQSIHDLPYNDREFDGLISVSVLYYFVKQDIEHIVDEIYRVLKPGGYAFFVIRSVQDKRYGKGAKIEENTYKMTDNFSNEENMTIHFFTEDEINQLFNRFSSVSVGFLKESYGSLGDYDFDYLVTVCK